VLAMAEKKKTGRPPKPDKPLYTTIKVDVEVHALLRSLAGILGTDIATLASDTLRKHITPRLDSEMETHLRNRKAKTER